MASATGSDTGKVAYIGEKGISDPESPTYDGDVAHGDVQDFREKAVLKYAFPAQQTSLDTRKLIRPPGRVLLRDTFR